MARETECTRTKQTAEPAPRQTTSGKETEMSDQNEQSAQAPAPAANEPLQPPLAPPTTPSASEPPPPATPAPSKDERTLALLCHLLGALVGFIVPLILWLVKKDTMPFVDDQGKEALNFQITMVIAFVACGVLTMMTCGFGSFLFLPLWAADIVLGIMAGIKANEGVCHRYPFALRLIK
jgi:uncharacterized Tic20 family protein